MAIEDERRAVVVGSAQAERAPAEQDRRVQLSPGVLDVLDDVGPPDDLKRLAGGGDQPVVALQSIGYGDGAAAVPRAGRAGVDNVVVVAVGEQVLDGIVLVALERVSGEPGCRRVDADDLEPSSVVAHASAA